MSEVYINKEDIRLIIEEYKNVDNTFVLRSFVDGPQKKECFCNIHGKECRIIFYIKKNCVNILPTGKNVEESNLLIDYISSKGYSANTAVRQFSFDCTISIVNSMITYIYNEFKDIIKYEQSENILRFTGYNGDVLTFTFFPQTNKAMIQGKPFQVFGIIISYLSNLTSYSFDQIVNISNSMIGVNTPSTSIRAEMKAALGTSYNYLDEALLKSISGSISLLKQSSACEDYTGCVTGIFKAIEGYLKKLLSTKYGYILNKHNTFGMFYKNNNTSEIDNDDRIPDDEKRELIGLNILYSSKRNVFLHATVDPSQTRIIETKQEAQEIANDILRSIKTSYEVIFAKNT